MQDHWDASLRPGLEESRGGDQVWQGLQAEAMKAQGIQAPARAPGGFWMAPIVRLRGSLFRTVSLLEKQGLYSLLHGLV